MVKILPLFARPTWHWQIYKNAYHYTSLLYSTFAPTLAFSCLLIGFIPSDIFNQPRLLWADWQIGGVITTTKHALWGQFYFKKGHTHIHTDTCTQTYVCVQAWLHTYTQVWQLHLISTLDLSMVITSFALPSGASVLPVLFTADKILQKTRKAC